MGDFFYDVFPWITRGWFLVVVGWLSYLIATGAAAWAIALTALWSVPLSTFAVWVTRDA